MSDSYTFLDQKEGPNYIIQSDSTGLKYLLSAQFFYVGPYQHEGVIPGGN